MVSLWHILWLNGLKMLLDWVYHQNLKDDTWLKSRNCFMSLSFSIICCIRGSGGITGIISPPNKCAACRTAELGQILLIDKCWGCCWERDCRCWTSCPYLMAAVAIIRKTWQSGMRFDSDKVNSEHGWCRCQLYRHLLQKTLLLPWPGSFLIHVTK